MNNFFIIWRRELTACFLSPVAYVTMVVYLALSGLLFLLGVDRRTGTSEPLETILFSAIFFGMPVLVTVISMRMFAEEKRAGTIETLMTAPVTEAEVVLGKYAGALSFFMIVALPAVNGIFVLSAMSPGVDYVDKGGIVGGCLILLLTSAFSTAIGLLVSLMTKNQIIAAICCFCAVISPIFLKQVILSLPFGPERLAEYVSVETHILDFARGSIDSRPMVLYLSGTIFLLFAAVRVLESRRWR